jgi:hypothetical protein
MIAMEGNGRRREEKEDINDTERAVERLTSAVCAREQGT